MGYNIAGIAINKNFNKDPQKLIKDLELPLVYEGEVDFETGTSYKEEGYFDIFFSEKGTIIYSYGPIEFDAKFSKGCSMLNFAIGETSMVFHFELFRNGERVRVKSVHEDKVLEDNGDKLEVEEGENELMEIILKQKGQLFGQHFNEMALELKGHRFKMIQIKEEEIYKAPFYDSNSLASNPGKMKLNFFRWIMMNFKAFVKNMAAILIGFFLMMKLHWIFALVFIGALLYNIWYWFMAYNTFAAGDVNPGKVLSINPDRVAVATNLTKMFGDYPILKIIETNLPKFEKKAGNYIPTVALYKDNPYDYPFWAEFLPVPVSHGTSDKAILKARFETFKDEDFETLNNYIDQVPTYEVGTYKVNIESSGWKDYPDVTIGSIDKMEKP